MLRPESNSFSAVIGTIEDHVQVITASPFALLPRLIPAPQALLRTERPTRLPSIKGVDVAGVYSGWHIRELNYFAAVIHDIASLKDFEFRLYEIDYNRDAVPVDSFRKSLWYRIQFWKKPLVKTVREMEAQEMSQLRQSCGTNKHTTVVSDTSPVSVGSQDQSFQRAPTIKDSKTQKEYVKIPLKVFCTINFVTLLSFAITIALFVGAALIHDGVACVAFACISVSTSLACWSAQWQPIMA